MGSSGLQSEMFAHRWLNSSSRLVNDGVVAVMLFALDCHLLRAKEQHGLSELVSIRDA